MTLFGLQVVVIVTWLLGSIVTSLLALRHHYRTGKPHTTLAMISVTLAGSFLYFLWPKMGRLSDVVTSALLPALVLSISATLFPVVTLISRKVKPKTAQ